MARKEPLADRIANWIGRHLPERIRYWVFIQQGIDHIHYHETVPEVGYTEILGRVKK